MFFLALLVLGGCGVSVPSANDAQREVERQIDEQSGGRVDLLSFRKTDGQRREVYGRAVYILEFEASVEYTEACRADFGCCGNFNSFKTLVLKKPDCSDTDSLTCAQNRVMQNLVSVMTVSGPDVEQGHRETIAGVMTFEKMEQGWRLASQTMKRQL